MNDLFSKILAFGIVLAIVVISLRIFIPSEKGGEEQYRGVSDTAAISPKCGGLQLWQSLVQCQSACNTKNAACDTTYCNPQDPRDATSDRCDKFLEKMKNRAFVEVLPREVKLDDKTASITITVKDKDKNIIKAKAEASGAGSGQIDDTTSGPMAVTLKSVGGINIAVTPKDPKISGSQAVVSVVK